MRNRYELTNGYCAYSKYHGPNKAICAMSTGMVGGGCPTYNKMLCAKPGASAAAVAEEDGPVGVFLTGPFAGSTIIKVNHFLLPSLGISHVTDTCFGVTLYQFE